MLRPNPGLTDCSIIFVSCSLIAMGIVWWLTGFSKSKDAYREQLPAATFNCLVLGTLLALLFAKD